MPVLIALLLLAAPATPSEEVKEAREHFKSGQTHYALGEFEQAILEFRETYRLRQEPALLFNIGQCYRQLKDWQQAYFNYRQYLNLKPDAPNKDEVESLIEQMRYSMDTEREQKTRVATDPAAAHNTERVLPAVHKEPESPWVHREPAPPAALPAAQAAQPPVPDGPMPTTRLAAYVAAGTGVALEGVALLLHGSAQSSAEAFNRKYAAGQLTVQDGTLKNNAEARGKLATVALLGGAALIATGAALYFAF